MLSPAPLLLAAAQRLDTPDVPWKALCLTLIGSVYALEQLIALRQLPLYSRTAPPAALAAHVDAATFDKSQKYGRHKARYALVAAAVNTALTLAFVWGDVYAWAWNVAATTWVGTRWAGHEIATTALFIPIVSLVREIPTLPLSYYRHFCLEEAHGFNKMTRKTFVLDWLKETTLGFAIMLPVISALIALIRWAGDSFVGWTVAFLLAFQITAMLLYPTLIQPLFNTLVPLPEGALRERIVALASALKFPLSKIYVIDGSTRSSHSNAYFYGVVPGGNKHIVIYDTLLAKSTPDEIEAVLAHELGHWAHSDPLKLLLLSQAQIFWTLSLFTLAIHNRALFRACGFNVAHGANLPVVVGLELFQLMLAPCDALIKFLVNACVRRMEYAADAFAQGLPRPPPTAGDKKSAAPPAEPAADAAAKKDGKWQVPAGLAPEPAQAKMPYAALLSRALIKLHVQNLSSMHHDALYSAYHYSHPTLEERLRALEARKSE